MIYRAKDIFTPEEAELVRACLDLFRGRIVRVWDVSEGGAPERSRTCQDALGGANNGQVGGRAG